MPFAIFITGGFGVGKTTVLDHVGDLLAETGRPFSLLDVDWFHRSWPVADDDPENRIIEARNIRAVWENYRAAGPRQVVVTGVLRNDADRRRYEQALGMELRSVRLEAGRAEVERRLARRYPDRPDALRWHLENLDAPTSDDGDSAVDELVLSTEGVPPRETARAIVDHFFGPAAP